MWRFPLATAKSVGLAVVSRRARWASVPPLSNGALQSMAPTVALLRSSLAVSFTTDGIGSATTTYSTDAADVSSGVNKEGREVGARTHQSHRGTQQARGSHRRRHQAAADVSGGAQSRQHWSLCRQRQRYSQQPQATHSPSASLHMATKEVVLQLWLPSRHSTWRLCLTTQSSLSGNATQQTMVTVRVSF